VFDILTVAAVADELSSTIMDGRIQKVGMLSRMSIGFEIYAERKRWHFIASAENDDPRVLLLDRQPSFDTQLVTPLLLLLRKYVRGGTVVGIEQPPLDRVVRLSIAKRLGSHNDPSELTEGLLSGEEDEDPDGLEGATFVNLVIEIMGRHSNIMLVDDEGRIMESVKRVTTAMSRVRPIAPRTRYTEPPAGDRLDPRRLTSAECETLFKLERPGLKLASLLPSRLRGVSPQMAREIAYRVTGDIDAVIGSGAADLATSVARETRRLLEPLLTSSWSPETYLGGDGEVEAFAAIPMEHLRNRLQSVPMESISRAAELSIDDGSAATPGKHSQRRLRLMQTIESARGRLDARLTSLQVEEAKSGETEKLRRWGELIYGYIWMINPGDSELEVESEIVPLIPGLTAKESATAYFEQYRKAQSAGEHVPVMIETVHVELAYLDQVLTQAQQADTFQEMEEIAIEWEAHQRSRGDGPRGAVKRKPRSSSPRRTRAAMDHHGNAIYVGRNGPENDRITFDIAGPNDTWLHARGIPGSHVIVRWANPAGDEDSSTIEVAASLASYFSASRESGSVEVDITRRRFVRKIKGAGPGMVTYRNERTIRVKPKNNAE